MVCFATPVGQGQVDSQWEKWMDDVMTEIDTRIERFEIYVKSPEGRYKIKQVQMIATFAVAIILAFKSPFIVVGAVWVGSVVKAFSPELLDHGQQIISSIAAILPLSVKVLTTVATLTYVPIAFPILAGLCVGFELNSRISPHSLANRGENASSIVLQTEDEDMPVHGGKQRFNSKI